MVNQSPLKGRTYEEVFGVEKALQIKQRLSEKRKLLFTLGLAHPMKGRHHSKTTKEWLRNANSGKIFSPSTLFKKGSTPWNKGLTNKIDKRIKKHTEEWKRKLQERMIGNKYNLGHKQTEEHRQKTIDNIKRLWKNPDHKKRMSDIGKARNGSKSINWKGGLTPINRIIRHSENFKNWREAVFKRDNYTCQECYDRSGNGHAVNLHPHHIKYFARYPLLRFDINNGITLCKQCHDNVQWKEEKYITYFQNKISQSSTNDEINNKLEGG